MARLQLNKASLSRESANLRTYRRFMPSLDLKRRELMAQRARAAQRVVQTRAALEGVRDSIGEELPMLSNTRVDLSNLARVQQADLGEENLMGVRLPVLRSVRVSVRDYSLLAKPHWVDRAAARLQEMLILRLRLQVETRRLALLEKAVQRITQRVNLFEKVLIPRTLANIRRLRIHLSDLERAGVVNAKIAKGKRAAEAEP